MIAAWMIYTTAVTVLVYTAARAADYLIRALNVPTRFVWAAAIAATLALSGRAFVGRQTQSDTALPAHPAPSPQFRTTVRLNTDQPFGNAWRRQIPIDFVQTFLMSADAASRAVDRAYRRIDVATLGQYDVAFAALWLATSTAALIYLATSLAGMRRMARTLQPTIVDGHHVLVSNEVGPAVLGALHPRIVVPRWVLSLSLHDRQIILTHEREHATSFDPALLRAAALALIVQPWNIALWALFARLGLAIEADCDRRVLDTVGDARMYGRLLVSVYQRSTPGRVPYVAFVKRPSNLERRILRMTRTPRAASIGGATAALAAITLATTAWITPIPSRPVMNATNVPTPRDSVARPAWTAQVSAPPPSSVATSVRAVRSTPCMISGRLRAPVAPDSLRPMSDGCTVDGGIVVVALDSHSVLVAFRDAADAGRQDVDYLVFATADNSAPVGLRWSTMTNGHAEYRGNTFYIASPSAGIPAMAFGGSATTLEASYPSALRLVISNLEILHRPWATWNVLLRLPTSARCVTNDRPAETRPLLIIDGAITNSDCFVVDGQALQIP